MRIRSLLTGLALLGAVTFANPAGAVGAADDDAAAVAELQTRILAQLSSTTGGSQDVMAAIANTTRGVELAIIVEAVCPLTGANLATLYDGDAAAIAQARSTLARDEVRSGISETCDVARVALASYGATGGVPAGGAPGQAFGSGGVGAPGGGGGSGYIN